MKHRFMLNLTNSLLGLSLLGAAGAASATQTINFGVQPATQPIYIAKAAGMLDAIEKKYDVKIAFHSFSYGAPENQAMAAGALDLASAGMGPAIVASARLPAKLLAITILEQTAIIIPADSTITSVAELKGKRVAYPGKGSQQYPLLLRALQDAGLTVDDIELFKTKGSDVPTLVEQHSVDAGITWDPHVSKALAGGKTRVLLKAEKILPLKSGHYIGNGVYGRTEFIDANPELVGDIMVAITRAVKFIIDNPDQAIAMWSKEIGFDPAVISYSLKEGISVYNTDIVPSQKTIDEYTVFLKQADILKPTDTPKIAPEYAAKALTIVGM